MLKKPLCIVSQVLHKTGLFISIFIYCTYYIPLANLDKACRLKKQNNIGHLDVKWFFSIRTHLGKSDFSSKTSHFVLEFSLRSILSVGFQYLQLGTGYRQVRDSRRSNHRNHPQCLSVGWPQFMQQIRSQKRFWIKSHGTKDKPNQIYLWILYN